MPWHLGHILLLVLSGCSYGLTDSVDRVPDSGEVTSKRQKLTGSTSLVDGLDLTSAQTANSRVNHVLSDVDNVLEAYREEPIRLQASPWVRMHAMVQYPGHQSGYQREALISNVISSPIVGVGVLVVRDGVPFPRADGPLFGRQHHPDQVLNYLSLAGIDLSEPMTIEGHRFPVQDLLTASMHDVWRDRELSWTVSAYAHYLKPGHRWTNRFGEELTLAILVQALLNSDEDACGGTHRLAALARVVSHDEFSKDEQLSSVWTEARSVLRSELATLHANQLESGFFALPPVLSSMNQVSLVERNIQFTGHTIEWFSILSEPQLARSDWVVKAVEAVAEHLPQLHDRYRDAIAPPIAWTALEPPTQFTAGSVSHAVGALSRWRLRVRE